MFGSCGRFKFGVRIIYSTAVFIITGETKRRLKDRFNEHRRKKNRERKCYRVRSTYRTPNHPNVEH